MKTATISETKSQLSALLDRVRHGETILIRDRRKPVARLEPVVSASGAGPDEGRLARLGLAGVIRHARHGRLEEIVRVLRLPLNREAISLRPSSKTQEWPLRF